VKKLLERSSVLSFWSLPSSEGICPDILLFCRSLQKKKKTALVRNSRLNISHFLNMLVYLHKLEICQVADAW
jgi:hypothetical protein